MATEGVSALTSILVDVASVEEARSQPFEIDLKAPEGAHGQSSEGTFSTAACSGDWGQMPERVSLGGRGGIGGCLTLSTHSISFYNGFYF